MSKAIRFHWWPRALATLLLLVAALWGWGQVSPWPSAMVIRAVFSSGGAHTAAALGKHVPRGTMATFDVPYAPGNVDETLDVFVPRTHARPLTTIVWIHGGGFVAGDKSEIANYARILAAQGYGVVTVNYTLSPEAHYPTQLQQLNHALAWVSANAARHGLDRNRIVLAGDSAGAQLAAQLANLVTSPAYAQRVGVRPALLPAQVIGAVLFCGPYDSDYAKPAPGAKPSWFMQTVMWSYMGRKDFWNHPGIDDWSVARHVTRAFPPAFVSVGNHDPLQQHSYAMASALQRAGVRVDTLFWPKDLQPGLPHEYQFNLDHDAGREALRRLTVYLAGL